MHIVDSTLLSAKNGLFSFWDYSVGDCVIWDSQSLRTWLPFAHSVEAATLFLHLIISCVSVGFAFKSENISQREN